MIGPWDTSLFLVNVVFEKFIMTNPQRLEDLKASVY